MIAYYAHSHGNGHCNYAQLFAQKQPSKSVILTDSDFDFDDNLNVTRLENENLNNEAWSEEHYSKPDYMHYAPLGMQKISRRNEAILHEINKHKIQFVIVDVSVEVATLLRVSSIPYAYVRMFGNRNDMGHLQAYHAASFLLAYYPKELEPKETPDWVVEKTVYLGFVSATSKTPIPTYPNPIAKKYILLLQGMGGNDMNSTLLQKLVSFFYPVPIVVVGKNSLPQMENVINGGIVVNTAPYIQHADMVIAGCGMNTVSEVLSYGKPFIGKPEERPFEEQKWLLKALVENNLAVLLQPDALDRTVAQYTAINTLGEEAMDRSDFSELWDLFERYGFDFEKVSSNVSITNNRKEQSDICN
ncbi:hypothetical protein [Luteirhabdus pelagi]|uniref:hypothetical protein n=1 Tax=Luteirhabdus pelagi TaxID=2792783 RepID=UPI001939DDA9|nr:hypothetical protein [Luteirhabdus pelagi]